MPWELIFQSPALRGASNRAGLSCALSDGDDDEFAVDRRADKIDLDLAIAVFDAGAESDSGQAGPGFDRGENLVGLFGRFVSHRLSPGE